MRAIRLAVYPGARDSCTVRTYGTLLRVPETLYNHKLERCRYHQNEKLARGETKLKISFGEGEGTKNYHDPLLFHSFPSEKLSCSIIARRSIAVGMLW